ncbi:MAG: sugar phosphate isomerase/epimerase family protein [Chthoniobacteraceae bacterium]
MQAPFLISFCSLALRERPVFEAVEAIARAGFKGVELWYAHIERLTPGELVDLRERCRARGLSIPVLSPYFAFTRGRERALESLRTAEKVLEAARVLGVKKIRTFIDCGPDGLPSSQATPGQWKAACEGLRELCALDESREFVVETHEWTLADTLPSVRRVLEETGAPNLRLNYQASRDFLERGFLQCLEELLPVISHLHWEQVREGDELTYLEEPGLIDFPAIMRLLLSRGYRGTASVEYCWPEVAPERIGTAWQYLTGVWEQIHA